MNSKRSLLILILCVLSVCFVFSDSSDSSAAFGIVWTYSNGNNFVPETSIEILDINENVLETIEENGMDKVRDDIALSVSDDEQYAFIVKFTSNESGRHTISYRVSPLYNEAADTYSGYTLRYILNSIKPSVSASGSLSVGNNGNLTYPANSSDFNTSFVLPTLADPVSLYIEFFVTLNTEDLPAGQNRSTIVIIQEGA